MRKLLVLVSLTSLVGCGVEPLQRLQLGQTSQPRPDNSAQQPQNQNQQPQPDDEEEDFDPGEDVVVVPDEADPVVCVDGGAGASWHDLQPSLPASVPFASALGRGSDEALASCAGDDVIIAEWSLGDAVSSLGHLRGQHYFEVEVQEFEEGWSQIGVFAEPADVHSMDAFFMDEISAAGTDLSGARFVGVAVDLDAGVAGFYDDGELVDVKDMAILPGIGAFFGGAMVMSGNTLAANFGAAPFAFAPPAGFGVWQRNDDGSEGACHTEEAPSVSTSALTTTACDNDGGPCHLSTFDAGTDADVELVVLGTYDSGSQANWEWNVDDAGNVTQRAVDGGHSGSILVEVNRPGRIALVLSAYEPTDWTLAVAEGVELVSVSVYGMHAQSLTGAPADVPVDLHSICTDRNGGGSCDDTTGEDFPVAPSNWPFETGGGDTQGFIRFIESELCLPLKLFGGTYYARGFSVN